MKSAAELVAEAEKEIDTWTVEEAMARTSDPKVQLVDIRDIRELWRLGTIPGAFHAPRGMLEFWVDPASPYAKAEFQKDKTYVLFCGSGWRSALATKTLQDMGFGPVAHIGGGFSGWTKAGGPVSDVKPPPTSAAARP